jgi:lipopolysaccharide export system protein LptC
MPPQARAHRPDETPRGQPGTGLALQGRSGKMAASAQSRAKLAAGRHSRFVRRAKIWLPILGLLILAVVIGRAYLLSRFPGIKMPAVLFSKNGLTMVEPRLTGRSRDRAYDFGAVRATQNYASPKVVEFEQLSGRVELKDNGWAKVEARTGRYDGTNDGLNLAGHVTVTTSTGYLLNAQDAAIDLTKGNMSTDNPVHIDGPTGSIDAKAAQVTDSGNTILFSGGVHVTINPATVPASIGPSQPDQSLSVNVPANAAPQSTPIGPKP